MTSQADGYVFVKGCASCPLRTCYTCSHPAATTEDGELYVTYPYFVDNKDKAHPDCPLRKHSLHIALEPTA